MSLSMATQLFTQFEPEDEPVKQRSIGTGIRFCPECQNMLVPRAPENREDPLMYHCEHCNRNDDVQMNRVYVNVLKRSSNDSYLSKRIVGDDPTLERVVKYCETCNEQRDCVIFMAPSLAGEEQFSHIFECTHCRTQWSDKDRLA